MLSSLLIICLFSNIANCLKLWSSPAFLPAEIPAPCKAALSTDLACGPDFITPGDILNDVPYDVTFLGEYCNSTCSTSFNTYISNINTRCGNIIYSFGRMRNGSAISIVAPMKWARDTACITGTSASEYCYPQIINQTLGFCDDCTLKYLSSVLSSAGGLRKINEESFTSILSECGVSPTKYHHSSVSLSIFVPPAATGAPSITCWGGTKYTAKQGDTCQSVATANSMALDRFLYLNSIDFNCSSFPPGRNVCIRDACKLYTIKPKETCKNITDVNGFTKAELVQWNPILETGCDNTTALVGRPICITPPGTDKYNFTPTASFAPSWTFPSGSWEPAPTQGTPLGNITKTTWDIPTTTGTWTANINPSIAAYYKNCPLTNEHWNDGFDWSVISNVCSALLNRYCYPITTGTPLPSTTFPSSCFPPYPEPTEIPE